MSEAKKTIDIITSSVQLKRKLKYRIKEELKLSNSKVIKESINNGIKGLNKANLSRYFSSDEAISGLISQKLLLYLVMRYGIDVRIKIKALEYNEEECIQKVKALFKL